MFDETIQFFVRPPYQWNPLVYELHARIISEGEKYRYSYPTSEIVWKTEETNPMEQVVERPPLLLLSERSCQILIDQLWKAGIRPTEGHGSAGAFASQGKHLEDMRRIVGKTMGLKLKEQEL